MKKFLKITALLCAVVLLLAGCTKAENDGFTVFKSSPMNFRLEYPSHWTMQINNETKTAAFVTPGEGYSDQYRDNVTVTVSGLGTASDFANYAKLYEESLPSTLKGFSLTASEEIFLDGKEAIRLTYKSQTTEKDKDGKEVTTELKFLQCIAFANDQVYTFTFMAEPNSYDYFLPYVETMIGTLRFKA